MAARSRLISKITPWSSLLKAAAYGIGWLLLPGWLFFVLALALYFLPVFRPFETLLPFLVLLGICLWSAPGFFFAVVVGGAFYLILGMKDLVLIRRDTAYEALLFLLLFILFFDFFKLAVAPDVLGLLPASLGLAAIFGLLLRDMMRRMEPAPEPARVSLAAGLSGLMLWQWSFALVFLPINYFYATAILFLGAVVIVETATGYFEGSLDREKILSLVSLFLIVAVIVLAMNRWTV